MRKTVAVMQPYFFPYGGYFSLLHSVDHFVMFDCVQFPRRGWVHRNRVPGPTGQEEWLTIPLQKQPREVRICDLAFAPEANVILADQLRRYPWIARAEGQSRDLLHRIFFSDLPTPAQFLAKSIQEAANLLGLNPDFSFSSDLKLDPMLRGQDRVIAVAKAVGATRYVNLSGGTGLYDRETFRHKGLELSFLGPYAGSKWSLLYRLATEDPAAISREVALNAGAGMY